MGLRIQKRIKLAKGVNLNLSKSGIGISVGGKGARVGIGSKGVRTSVGIPGTGVRYETRRKLGPKSGKSRRNTVKRHPPISAKTGITVNGKTVYEEIIQVKEKRRGCLGLGCLTMILSPVAALILILFLLSL